MFGCAYIIWSFVRIAKLEFPLTLDHLSKPVVSRLILMGANLLHLLINWLIVSSLSPYNLHLLFCCILSIFALLCLVIMALFCAAIRKDLVFLWRFPFLARFTLLWLLLLVGFSHKRSLVVFYWSFNDSKYIGFLEACQYSRGSKQCCSHDGISSLIDVRHILSLLQAFGDRSGRINYLDL